MTKNERRVLFFSIAFPFYILFMWLAISPFLGQLFFAPLTESGLFKAFRYDRSNATYSYVLGRLYHYGLEHYDPEKARRYYKESLSLNPLQGGCWLDLAKASETAGSTADAGYAIKRAIRLVPKNPSVRWEAGVFYLNTGDIDASLENFREFVLLQPEKQYVVYDLVWKLGLDARHILEALVPKTYAYYRKYLSYLVSTERINESKDVWNAMKGFEVEDEEFIKYTDFLISRHLYEDARDIWNDFQKKKTKPSKENGSAMPWNGSFEEDIVNGGYDWKINETKGVDVFLDRDTRMLGSRSLGVTFDGTQNPGVSIASQVVIVRPNTGYVLRGNIKTGSLTTSNGLVLSVEGHDCKGFYRKSDAVTGTNFWKEVVVEFNTPPDCNAVLISIKREKSTKLDNKISGNAWIDGINMVQK